MSDIIVGIEVRSGGGCERLLEVWGMVAGCGGGETALHMGYVRHQEEIKISTGYNYCRKKLPEKNRLAKRKRMIYFPQRV